MSNPTKTRCRCTEQPKAEVADFCLQKSLPADETAIHRLPVLPGQSVRAVVRELGSCSMPVSRREKALLAEVREQLT